MKRMIFTAIMALVCLTSVSAQADNGEKELSRKEKKALQDRIDSTLHEEALTAIEDTLFTLEADEVVFKYGQTAYVTPNTNFVAIDKDNAVVQVAFNIPVAGPNGIGGITVSGRTSGYKKTTDKRGNTYVSMNVMGAGISAQVTITLWNESNSASVSINPNFNSRKLSLNGVLLPQHKSNVFQGRTF